jgi:lipopolysaccharide export system protein LptA
MRAQTHARTLSRRRSVLAAAMTLAAGFAVALFIQPAAAQKNQNPGPPNALQGFSQNRDQPVKIQAASLEVREKDKLATFSGDVQVFQGDTEMRCKVLQVFYEQEPGKPAAKAAEPGPGAQNQIRKIEAKGGVTVVQKDQNATGDSATFNMLENTVTLVGNVVVARGQDVIRGQRLVVNLTSGVSRMEGGRVEGLFPSAAHASEKK